MESLQVEVLNPKAKKLLEDLAELDLINIKSLSGSKKDFFKMVDRLRSKNEKLTLEQITKEVDRVRLERHSK